MSRSLRFICTASIQSTSAYLYFYLYFNSRPIPFYSQVSKFNSPYSRTKRCTFVHWSINCLDLQFHSSLLHPLEDVDTFGAGLVGFQTNSICAYYSNGPSPLTFSGSQENPSIYETPRVRDGIYKGTPSVSMHSQINPVHAPFAFPEDPF